METVERSTGKKPLAALSLLALGAGLLLFPGQARESVSKSVLTCLSSLVPSLFPFLVLASLGVRSGAGALLGRLLAPLTRRAFRLPAICGAPLLLSFLGGYPAGARGVSLLLEEKQITREQAGRMMAFCVAPGPAFVVTFVGWGIWGSLERGWLLFAAVTLSGLLLGILSGLGKPFPQERAQEKDPPAGSALVLSVSDACSATAKMCGCILLFAGITAILRASGLFRLLAGLLEAAGPLPAGEAQAALSFVMEVTGGAADAAQAGASPALFAFGLAFGGLCVHLQLFSFFRKFPLSKGKFFLFRVLHGAGSAGLFLLLDRLVPGESAPAWAASTQPLHCEITASTAAGGLSMLLMCLAFLVYVGKPFFSQKTELDKKDLPPRHGSRFHFRGLREKSHRGIMQP